MMEIYKQKYFTTQLRSDKEEVFTVALNDYILREV